MATGQERTDELTPEDRDRYTGDPHIAWCMHCECLSSIITNSVNILVEAFVDDASPEAKLIIGPDMRKILLAFQIMKVFLSMPIIL